MKIVSMSKNYLLYAKSAPAFSEYEICTGELDNAKGTCRCKNLKQAEKWN